DDGEVIVDIEQFTMKRVNDSAGTLRRPAAAPAPATVEKEQAAVGQTAAAEPSSPAAAPQAAPHVDLAGSGGILPHEGVEALRRALSRDVGAPQVVVTAKDLHAMIEQVNAVNPASLLDAAGIGSQPATVHARPNIPTPYVAPSTENERRLAVIWQATLGIEQVGVNDNFFDLGGDSILGIQVIARASDAGFQLSPDQLFEHQTITELAKLFEDVAAESLASASPLPVTPYQLELLESAPAAACWYTVWPLSVEAAAEEIVGAALREVVTRHEALRTRFTRGSEGWTQLPAGVPEDLGVREMSLTGALGPADLARELRAGLDPERGVLLAAAVLSDGEAAPKRALFVAHPLAADATSWDLIRDELRTICRQLSAGQVASLPAVTASFSRWLAARGGMAAGKAWTAATPAGPDAVSVRLGDEETRVLLEEIPELQRIRVEEVVLAALAGTVARSTGAVATPILVDADLREATAADLDLSRTIGCFSISLPVLFELAEAADAGEELRLAKKQLRATLAEAACGNCGPEEHAPLASFVYLGEAQAIAGRGAGLRTALAVTGQLDGEGLRFDWRAGDDTLFAVQPMAEEFLAKLRSLIEFCLSPAVAVYTPSDFPDADLNQEDLDKLFS
ncbi:MAG TPA: phosphopantetheine-binding protein, partial [Thermoanaerobaculia bacterium]|nr:phosphopantetheine-binding protein [Thermoanaerobaculia bacterium]